MAALPFSLIHFGSAANSKLVALPKKPCFLRSAVKNGCRRGWSSSGHAATEAADRELDSKVTMEFKHQATVTLAEVADAAGVGESTVSRVLRNHGSFSGKTRDRVMAAVERLGYVPNRIAGTLASTASRLVAFVIPSLSNIVFPDVLRGASAILEENRYQAVFSVTDYDPEK